MDKNTQEVAFNGDLFIWITMFSILVIIVAYLAYINKDIER